jgi:hypothetical protein
MLVVFFPRVRGKCRARDIRLRATRYGGQGVRGRWGLRDSLPAGGQVAARGGGPHPPNARGRERPLGHPRPRSRNGKNGERFKAGDWRASCSWALTPRPPEQHWRAVPFSGRPAARFSARPSWHAIQLSSLRPAALPLSSRSGAQFCAAPSRHASLFSSPYVRRVRLSSLPYRSPQKFLSLLNTTLEGRILRRFRARAQVRPHHSHCRVSEIRSPHSSLWAADAHWD